MLNIVIPMAGAGSRFAQAGYKDPKPLIPVHGTPMIKVVIDNLRPRVEHRFIFICQRTHIRDYNLEPKLADWAPGSKLVAIDRLTEGAACTVLTAKELIDNEFPLMIANSDQFVDVRMDQYLDTLKQKTLDGLIMTMTAHDPKWSFVAINKESLVTRVVEKEVISDEATVGIYNFSEGQDFVRGAEQMIDRDERVNGEFYVAPVYNLLIQDGQRIGIYNVGSEMAGMYGLGIPRDLENFLSHAASRRTIPDAHENT